MRPRHDTSQRQCANPQCKTSFSIQHPGLACSACKIAIYCNRSCQKEAWQSHKLLCKVQQEARQQWATEASQDRPHVEQDLSHLATGATFAALTHAISRSALRLGRPDSLAETHFLFFEMDYLTPPRERWTRTTMRPLGDERSLFTITAVEVVPVEELSKTQRDDKKAKTEHMLQSDSNARTGFLIELNAQRTDDREGESETYRMVYGSTCVEKHGKGILLEYRDRKPNPRWTTLVDIFNDLPVEERQRDEYFNLSLLMLTDLAMSETLEYLEQLGLDPKSYTRDSMGWEELKQFGADYKTSVITNVEDEE